MKIKEILFLVFGFYTKLGKLYLDDFKNLNSLCKDVVK